MLYSFDKTLGQRLCPFYQERSWSKNRKKEGFGSFHVEAFVESVPTCLGEVAFTSLTYWDHILSIPQVNLMCFGPINEAFMMLVEEVKNKVPLCCWIEV